MSGSITAENKYVTVMRHIADGSITFGEFVAATIEMKADPLLASTLTGNVIMDAHAAIEYHLNHVAKRPSRAVLPPKNPKPNTGVKIERRKKDQNAKCVICGSPFKATTGMMQKTCLKTECVTENMRDGKREWLKLEGLRKKGQIT